MNNIKSQKQHYISPSIEVVKLDNEISLALASDPPGYDNENVENLINNSAIDPFKSNLV